MHASYKDAHLGLRMCIRLIQPEKYRFFIMIWAFRNKIDETDFIGDFKYEI